MSDERNIPPLEDPADLQDDRGDTNPEDYPRIFSADTPDGVSLKEWEKENKETRREIAAQEAEKQIEGLSLPEIVNLAREGDRAAQSLALRQASRMIYAGQPLPPPLRSYISVSMRRRADGATWTKAFAPETEGRRERNAMLKAGADAVLVAIVDMFRNAGLSTTTDEGLPGPAFEEAAKLFHISPSRARSRYYDHLKATKGSKAMAASAVAALVSLLNSMHGIELSDFEENDEKR